MKKLLSVLVCVLLTVCLAAPALADVIWEPDDNFYYSHSDECERVECGYEARSDAVIRKSPQNSVSQGEIGAGETVFVHYIWRGWGYVELWNGGTAAGWVDLGSFRRLYNEEDFRTDHAGEIELGQGEISREENGIIYLWSFPGSGVTTGSIASADYDWAEDPVYSETWTDAQGRTWGYIGYYYLNRGWVCLDEPGKDDLPVTAPRYADEEPVHADPVGSSVPVLVIVLVAAVVLVTAAAIMLLIRKKTRS